MKILNVTMQSILGLINWLKHGDVFGPYFHKHYRIGIRLIFA